MIEGRTSDWSGEEYAAQADHHRSFDDWFLDRLPPDRGDVVVDLGCGSGEFTARVADIVTEGKVIGVEPDPSMLQAARRHVHPRLEFVQAPAEDLADIVERESVEIPLEGVRSVAQRRSFTRDQAMGLLPTQGAVAVAREADRSEASAIGEAAGAEVERLRGPDGSFDQTFVRLEILAQRPG